MKYPDKQIKTFNQLLKQKKSVWVTIWSKPSPMAFILSLPFRIVNMYLQNGYFYSTKEYK